MTKFEKLRQELLDKAKAAGASCSEYRRACQAPDEESLLKCIFDNLNWCTGNKVISDEYFAKFKKENFLKSGIANTGEGNLGFANAGNDNAGNDNAGNWNAGNRNAGYSNAGNDNAGAFNTVSNFMLFNKPTTWTYENFVESKAFALMQNIDLTVWIQSSQMSEQEKTAHPYHVTTGGYVKYIPYKEGFTNAWNNWSEENKKAFTDLPNWDAKIFFEITGVRTKKIK